MWTVTGSTQANFSNVFHTPKQNQTHTTLFEIPEPTLPVIPSDAADTSCFRDSPFPITISEIVRDSLGIVSVQQRKVVQCYVSALSVLGITKPHHLLAIAFNGFSPAFLTNLRQQSIVPWSLLTVFVKHTAAYVERNMPNNPPCICDLHVQRDSKEEKVVAHFTTCWRLNDLDIRWSRLQQGDGRPLSIGSGKEHYLTEQDLHCHIQVTILPMVTESVASAVVYAWSERPVLPLSQDPHLFSPSPWCWECGEVPSTLVPQGSTNFATLHAAALASVSGEGNTTALQRLLCVTLPPAQLEGAIVAACSNGRSAAAVLLLDVIRGNGQQNDRGVSAAIMTKALFASLPHPRCLKALLEMGLAPNELRTPDGNTALHEAAGHGLEAAVRTLLEGGADPNLRNTAQRTPLQLAALAGHFPVVQLLLDSGLINPYNRKVATILAEQHTDVRKMLLHHTAPTVPMYTVPPTAHPSQAFPQAAKAKPGLPQEPPPPDEDLDISSVLSSPVFSRPQSAPPVRATGMPSAAGHPRSLFPRRAGNTVSRPNSANAAGPRPTAYQHLRLLPQKGSEDNQPDLVELLNRYGETAKRTEHRHSPLAAARQPRNRYAQAADSSEHDAVLMDLLPADEVISPPPPEGLGVSHVGLRIPVNRERERIVKLHSLAGHSCLTIYIYYCSQYGVRPLQPVAQALPSIANVFDLEELTMGEDVLIGNRGLLPLLEVVRANEQLTHLGLGSTGIRNEGIEWFVHAALEHPAITAIDLSGNPFTERGGALLNYLAMKRPGLRYLNLSRTGVPEPLRRAIAARIAANQQRLRTGPSSGYETPLA
eukprot:TRINITY_DN7423_c0_g1_i1.p1 TRINITY_DN7423_c0_g1~~TRINITY_DN7423_c0_g1_i1.p1  ORF type:complete len:821 (-),score=117.82 TRINITY_DN7423_c0_g1_i1:22-2484(-)